MNAVHLRRVDPARNMHRFYRLDVQPDLCGGVLLMKEWGHIGARQSVTTPKPLSPLFRRGTLNTWPIANQFQFPLRKAM